MLALDGKLLLLIQEYIRNPVLDGFFRAVTHLGDGGGIWIIAALFLFFSEKSRRASIAVLLALLLTFLLNNLLLKNIFARTRPYEAVEGLLALIPAPRDYSFPSGHTASSFAAAISMYWNLPRLFGVCAVVLAVLIALSRLYVGVHYPTDVLGGAAGGAIAAYMAGYFLKSRRPDVR